MAIILIVDDDASILELLTDLVTDTGHTALCARNGQDALILAMQHHPPLIISDVMMPVMDGYALLTALRADPQLHTNRVVLISADWQIDPAVLGPRTVFLAKPLDLVHLESFLQGL